MLEKLLAELKINTDDIIKEKVLSITALKEINNFYQRIEDLINNPSFTEQRKYYAYDHVITHSSNVARYSLAVARTAKLSPKDCYEVVIAGVMHDVDKLYWPLTLLDKPKNELSKEDWTRIVEHAVASAVFVERLAKFQISESVLTIIKQHHENLDGTGYPNQISGKDISFNARIIRVIDSYDSMISVRPYKKQVLSSEAALNDLKSKTGIIYDPDIIRLLEETLRQGNT
ncbi:MAG: HD domain-containing phosphohydrolase [Planctomycetota bacterium]